MKANALRTQMLWVIFGLLLFGLVQATGVISAETNPPTPLTDADCVIPESGPWPPCATGGNTPSSPPNSDCIIPDSGPWPPCATGGSTPPSADNADCVIPDAGPWPACATGGDSNTPPPAPSPDESTEDPTQSQEFVVNNLTIVSKDKQEIRGLLDYSNIPDDLHAGFSIFDPDTCLPSCDSEDKFSRIGGGVIPQPLESRLPTSDAAAEFTIGLDNLLCPYEPVTNRLQVIAFDIDEVLHAAKHGGTVTIYHMFELEMKHEWCR